RWWLSHVVKSRVGVKKYSSKGKLIADHAEPNGLASNRKYAFLASPIRGINYDYRPESRAPLPNRRRDVFVAADRPLHYFCDRFSELVRRGLILWNSVCVSRHARRVGLSSVAGCNTCAM